MRRLAVIGLLGLACGETTNTPPSQLNLDRPTDMTFACMGGLRILPDDRTTPDVNDLIVFSAMPTTACDIRSGAHATGTPVPVPPGQEDLTAEGGVPVGSASWFGFILQSGPGTVAIAQFATKPATAFSGGDVAVLDADPLTPGKNGISVGEDPVAIATDKSGCKVLTANAGSCDLSVLDVGTAVDFDPNTLIDVRRVDVKNGNGDPIRAKPAAMVAEPQTDVIGKACPATETGAAGIVYIAYPSCHVVAAVDASTGTVVGGIQFDAAGAASIIDSTAAMTLSCPDECSGGGAASTGIRPITLDLEDSMPKDDPRLTPPALPDRRLVIGAENSPSLTVVDLLETTSLPDPIAVPIPQIALENTTGNLGVTRVALSPQIGMGGEIHAINDGNAAGGQFQFVYAVATDDTVRVADLLTVGKECDTQVDPRFTRAIRSVKDLSCMPVGDPATPPRRAGVRGPGIELLGDAVPTSVDIIKSIQIDGDARPDEDPGKLIGYFAIVSASNGFVFVVNIDDDDRRDLFSSVRPLLTPMPLLTPHTLRDGISDRGALNQVDVNGTLETECLNDNPGNTDEVIGGPRSATTPLRNFPAGVVSSEKIFALPGFRQLECDGVDAKRAVTEVQFSVPEDIRDSVFPDLGALRNDETWTLTWEGALSQDRIDVNVDGPAIRESQLRIDGTGMHVVDASKPFCSTGVEKFDILQMRGCDPSIGNGDCPIGYRCFVHPNSQIQGLGACLLDDEADRLADACRDFLTSVRRYTIGTTESGELQLLPRRVTLRTTPVDGCDTDAQCQSLADYAARLSSASNPVDDTTAPDPHTWTCQADPNRASVTTGKRCAMRCDATADCGVGTVCQGGTGSGKAGFCMEGVIPPQACVNAPQRYELHAGEAFAVLGTKTGFEHSIVADANGQCVTDANANRLIAGRIPLTPAACDPTADPFTGQLPGGGFEPNPCSTTIDTTDVVPLYLPGTCTLANPSSELRQRTAPAIRYRNRGMTLHIIDPTYPGDATCILDRAGNLGNIPHVFPNYQLTFRQVAGLQPVVLPVNPALPVRVVRGPTNSIWVVDEGDFLSTNIAQPSTRGKVFRIEPHALGLVNTLE